MVWVPSLFRKVIPYQIYDLQIFSPINRLSFKMYFYLFDCAVSSLLHRLFSSVMSSALVSIILVILGLWWFHLNFRIFFFYFCKKKKKSHWDFDEDSIESIDDFGTMDILTILSLLIHEHKCLSIYFCLLV